jgi:hypothetical protein
MPKPALLLLVCLVFLVAGVYATNVCTTEETLQAIEWKLHKCNENYARVAAALKHLENKTDNTNCKTINRILTTISLWLDVLFLFFILYFGIYMYIFAIRIKQLFDALCGGVKT